MTTKIILAIFVAAFLATAVLAKSATVQDEHFDLCKLKNICDNLAPSPKDTTLKPTVQLMKVAMFDLQHLGLSYARKAKNISDQLLKDPLIISSAQPEVVKFKQDIEEYEQKYLECSEMEALFDLVDLYSNATTKYYEMEKTDTLSKESKVILDVLKKYSPKGLDHEYDNRFLNKFVKKFGQKINQLKDKLKTEEGEMGVKVLQWWEKTKSLDTTDEKVKAFKEYMQLYGIDDE